MDKEKGSNEEVYLGQKWLSMASFSQYEMSPINGPFLQSEKPWWALNFPFNHTLIELPLYKTVYLLYSSFCQPVTFIRNEFDV